MQKKDILTFLQHLTLLQKSSERLGSPLEYIIYSPYVFNVLEGCKKEKRVMKQLLLKQLNISPETYTNIMGYERHGPCPDIDIFLEMHTSIPEYQKNPLLWKHKIYYSTIMLQYRQITGKTPAIFKNIILNPNRLDVRNICIPLNLMEYECRNIIRHHTPSLDLIRHNNLLLMLLSDFRDIVLHIRPKQYEYSRSDIDSFLELLLGPIDISPESIWGLDFHQLMQHNYEATLLK